MGRTLARSSPRRHGILQTLPNESNEALLGPAGRSSLLPVWARPLALAGTVALGGLLLLGLVIHGSLVEAEGPFLYGARRASEGGLPYRDFILPGMPYALYVYVPGGNSLLAARFISAFLGTCTLAAFAWIVRPHGWAGNVAALLLATSMSFSAGAIRVAPFSLALLAALVAFLLARSGRFLLAGLSAGVAAGSHAAFLPLVPVLALWPVLCGQGRRPALRCAAGAALALLPCLLIIGSAPSAWAAELSGTAASSRERSASVAEAALQLLLRPQWIVLWMLAAVGLARRRTPETLAALACASAVGILGFVLAPRSPTALLPALPFLLLTAIPALDVPLTRPWILAVLALWGLFLFQREREYESRVSQRHSMSPEVVKEVSAALRQYAKPGDTVLAFWPGYAALGGLRLPPGMESLRAYRDPSSGVPSPATIDGWIRERRHRVVQIGRHAQPAAEIARLIAILDTAGYERVFSKWDRYVYRVRE